MDGGGGDPPPNGITAVCLNFFRNLGPVLTQFWNQYGDVIWTWVLQILFLSVFLSGLGEMSLLMLNEKSGYLDLVWLAIFVGISGCAFTLSRYPAYYVNFIAFLSGWLHHWGIDQRFPRWHVINSLMNLALVFVTFKSVRPVIWTCSTSVTLVAALAIAYDRRDPTGFSEGITTGFFISFLTQLVEDDSNKHKLAVHWGVATFLCWLCSVARPPPQQGPQIQQGPGGQPPPVLQLGPQIPQAPGGQQPGVQQLGPQIHQAPGGQPPAVQQLGPLLQAAPGQPQQLDQEFFSVFRHQVSTFRNNVLTSRSHSTSSSDIRRNNLGIVIQ